MASIMSANVVLSSRVSIRGGSHAASSSRRVSLAAPAFKGGAAGSRTRRSVFLGPRAAVMNPGEAEPPKPRTEAIQNNTNPLSAESAVPVNKKAKGEPVRIKIDDQWYDCRGWAAAHPGGERWIHFFDGRDGTDAFYALHSNGKNGSSKAVDRLAKLPKCDPPPASELKKPSPSEYAASMSFRDFRKKLEKDGFFERNVFKEAWALVNVLGLYVAGQYFAYSNPFVARLFGETHTRGLGDDEEGGFFFFFSFFSPTFFAKKPSKRRLSLSFCSSSRSTITSSNHHWLGCHRLNLLLLSSSSSVYTFHRSG